MGEIWGETPEKQRRATWRWTQIDMFAGFSGATPNLWAMAGYDGMFLRWEGTDAQNRSFMANQGYEWIWVNAPLAPVFSHSCVFSARLLVVLRVVSAIDPDIGAVSQESSGSLAPNRSRIFTHSLMHVSQVKPAALSLVQPQKFRLRFCLMTLLCRTTGI